jgi:hypothetical protein
MDEPVLCRQQRIWSIGFFLAGQRVPGKIKESPMLELLL